MDDFTGFKTDEIFKNVRSSGILDGVYGEYKMSEKVNLDPTKKSIFRTFTKDFEILGQYSQILKFKNGICCHFMAKMTFDALVSKLRIFED